MISGEQFLGEIEYGSGASRRLNETAGRLAAVQILTDFKEVVRPFTLGFYTRDGTA